MSNARALAELERSPELFDHIAHLQRVADEEQQRRQQFYREVNGDTKAEFVNGQIVIHSPAQRCHLKATFYIARLLGDFVEAQELGEI